uniref:Uncharacterized protein n=1 Tax=Trichogramma kaykai TaxID=54128 RepID=A0ABD2X6V1_9HYME
MTKEGSVDGHQRESANMRPRGLTFVLYFEYCGDIGRKRGYYMFDHKGRGAKYNRRATLEYPYFVTIQCRVSRLLAHLTGYPFVITGPCIVGLPHARGHADQADRRNIRARSCQIP